MKTVTKKAILRGIRPLMFDRYAGDNNTELLPEQKMYFGTEKNDLVMPSANIHSFLCAENTKSAVKLAYDTRQYKKYAQAVLGFVSIEPFMIPITRNGDQIYFNGFDENGITVHKSVARLAKGVPNKKERPLVDLPWELEFKVTIYPNDLISDVSVRLLFEKGGIPIGLGTYRGVYGKFVVDSWE